MLVCRVGMKEVGGGNCRGATGGDVRGEGRQLLSFSCHPQHLCSGRLRATAVLLSLFFFISVSLSPSYHYHCSVSSFTLFALFRHLYNTSLSLSLSVRLHAYLYLIKAILRLCSSNGQLQLSDFTWRWENRFIQWVGVRVRVPRWWPTFRKTCTFNSALGEFCKARVAFQQSLPFIPAYRLHAHIAPHHKQPPQTVSVKST